VAKDRLKGKNTDNIDTYIDTSYLFPEILNNTKVKEEYNEKIVSFNNTELNLGSFPSKEYYDTLNDFLITKNPDQLILALRIEDHTIWEDRKNYEKFSRDLYLKQHKKLPEIYEPHIHHPTKLPKNKRELPDYFIVWRTLENWIQYYNPSTDLYKKNTGYKKMVNYLKIKLSCISPLLAIHKEKGMVSFAVCGIYEIQNDDGATSVVQKSKDGLQHYGYHSHPNYRGKKGYILEYSDGSGNKFDYRRT